MSKFNLQQELKFIHSEKMNIINKNDLPFKILNLAQILISNHSNAKTRKLRTFYKVVYLKTKNFYEGFSFWR